MVAVSHDQGYGQTHGVSKHTKTSEKSTNKNETVDPNVAKPAKKIPKKAKGSGGVLYHSNSKLIQALEKIIQNYEEAKLKQAEAYIKSNVQNMMQQAGSSTEDIQTVKDIMDQASASGVNPTGDANGNADHQVGNFFMILFEFLKKNMSENDDQMVATFNHMNAQSVNLTNVASQLQKTETLTEQNIHNAYKQEHKHHGELGLILGIVMAIVSVVAIVVTLGAAAPEAVVADVAVEAATEASIEATTEGATEAVTEITTETVTDTATDTAEDTAQDAAENMAQKTSQAANKLSQAAQDLTDQAQSLDDQASSLEQKAGSAAKSLAQRCRTAARAALQAAKDLGDQADELDSISSGLREGAEGSDQEANEATQQAAQRVKNVEQAVKDVQSTLKTSLEDGAKAAAKNGPGRIARAGMAIAANKLKTAGALALLAGSTAGPGLGVGIPQQLSDDQKACDTLVGSYLADENVKAQIESNISDSTQTEMKQDFQAGIQATTTNIQNDTNIASQTVQQMTRAQSIGSV